MLPSLLNLAVIFSSKTAWNLNNTSCIIKLHVYKDANYITLTHRDTKQKCWKTQSTRNCKKTEPLLLFLIIYIQNMGRLAHDRALKRALKTVDENLPLLILICKFILCTDFWFSDHSCLSNHFLLLLNKYRLGVDSEFSARLDFQFADNDPLTHYLSWEIADQVTKSSVSISADFMPDKMLFSIIHKFFIPY